MEEILIESLVPEEIVELSAEQQADIEHKALMWVPRYGDRECPKEYWNVRIGLPKEIFSEKCQEVYNLAREEKQKIQAELDKEYEIKHHTALREDDLGIGFSEPLEKEKEDMSPPWDGHFAGDNFIAEDDVR